MYQRVAGERLQRQEGLLAVARDELAGDELGAGHHLVAVAVQRHGGDFEIDSELGRGSTFKIYLPRVDS